MSYRHPITVNLCYYKKPTGESCNTTVLWKIKTDHGNVFKVCDAHLAWSLRFAGVPARVDEFVAKIPETEESKNPDRDDEITERIVK